MHNYLLLSSLCVILSSPSPLSHQSVSPPFPNPPPSLPSVLDDLPSHSLTFSLRLIPLTMHVPKTDLIFIRGANPAPHHLTPHPTPRPCTITLRHCLLSKSKSCSCPSQPSHCTTSRHPHAPPAPTTHTHMNDTPPLHILPYWNLEACVTGVSTNPWLFVSIKP